MKKLGLWNLLLLLVLSAPLLVGTPVQAATSVNITITAVGFICGAPGDFTLTYVTDNEVDISWVKGEDAENTLVRAAFGHVPASISDGYQVYYGTGTSCTDNAIDLATPSIVYYRAWSRNAGGVYASLFASGDTGGFMSISFLFMTLSIIGLVLFLAAFRWKDMLLSYAAFFWWIALGFWWMMGDIENFGMDETWVQILVWLPFILAFSVILRLMNTEITHESRGHSWKSWGKEPTRKSSAYEDYRTQLYNKTRRR